MSLRVAGLSNPLNGRETDLTKQVGANRCWRIAVVPASTPILRLWTDGQSQKLAPLPHEVQVSVVAPGLQAAGNLTLSS